MTDASTSERSTDRLTAIAGVGEALFGLSLSLLYRGVKVALVIALFVLGPPALGGIVGRTGFGVSPVNAMLIATLALAVAGWEAWVSV